jgi:fucose permease
MEKKSNGVYPVFLAFLCMGFGDVVGPMVALAKESFGLSNFMAQLLPLSGFLMFGILSVPMGVFQARRGKKITLVLGLAIACIGLLLPILGGMYGMGVDFQADKDFKYYLILLSVLLLGAGATIMQVSGNPIMRDVSAEGRFSSNLSLAQSIKAIGSSLGFLLPPFFIWAFGLDWTILFPIYAVVLLITCLWMRSTKVNEGEKTDAVSLSSCFALLKKGYVLLMVLGIFLYVGAECCMNSGVPLLLAEKFNFSAEREGLLISWSLFFLPVLVGRFVGAAVLRKMSANRFLLITVLLSLVGVLLVFSGNMVSTMAGVILVGLGFANIFPLIFSITVDKMPQYSNELSGLMITAILGGAIVPLFWGYVADSFSTIMAFAVPLVCLVYILLLSLRVQKD